MKIRSLVLGLFFIAAALLLAPPRSGAQEAPAPNADDFKVYWKDGVRLDTNDGAVKLHIGGRVQADANFVRGNDEFLRSISTASTCNVAVFPGACAALPATTSQPVIDTWGMRRLRLVMDGTVNDVGDFKIEMEFGNGVELADAYVGLRGLPGGTGLKVGHFKEPFSLEQLTSDTLVTFNERSLADSVFAPSRNFGAMVSALDLWDGKATAAVGVFKDVDNGGRYGNDRAESDDTAYAVTGRLTVAPILEDKGAELLHLGVSVSRREYNQNAAKFSTKPEIGMLSVADASGNAISSVTTVNTGTINGVRGGMNYAFEGAAEYAGVHVSGEYQMATLDRGNSSLDPFFWGYYLQAGYVLTGEARTYSKGVFGGVRPEHPFAIGKEGWGAFEIAGRVSHVNLNDASIRGGKEVNHTAGLNWYVTPVVRMNLNYVFVIIEDTTPNGTFPTPTATGDYTATSVNRLPGRAHALLYRFQVDI